MVQKFHGRIEDKELVPVVPRVPSLRGSKDYAAGEADGTYALREPTEAYGLSFAAESDGLRSKNAFLWYETVKEAMRELDPGGHAYAGNYMVTSTSGFILRLRSSEVFIE